MAWGCAHALLGPCARCVLQQTRLLDRAPLAPVDFDRRKDQRLDWMYSGSLAAKEDAAKRQEEALLGQRAATLGAPDKGLAASQVIEEGRGPDMQ